MKRLLILLLWIAILLLAFSCFLKLILGAAGSYGFNIFSFYTSFFIMLISIIGLTIIAVTKKPNLETWKEIRKAVYLLCIAIFLTILLGIIDN